MLDRSAREMVRCWIGGRRHELAAAALQIAEQTSDPELARSVLDHMGWGSPLDYADALLAEWRTGDWPDLSGCDCAVIGTGPSILDLRPADLVGYDLVAPLNLAARHCAGWHDRMLAFCYDDPGEPYAPAGMQVVTSVANSQYVGRCPIVLPEPLPISPVGSQGLAVWLLRMCRAASVTIFCCDSVAGSNINVLDNNVGQNYFAHPSIAMRLARGMRIRWRQPEPTAPITPYPIDDLRMLGIGSDAAKCLWGQ